MPKSKRSKQIDLTKTKKHGLEWKKKLYEKIRTAVDTYSNVYIFTVTDMRNSKMKNVREQWKDSRFFIGKNKIMAMALGRHAEEEYKPNLHKIGQRIKGQRALLFSNRSSEDVLRWFRSYSEGDFARSGNTATVDVKLLEGPLPDFPHNLEPYLRQLGLPTSLVKGIIHLVKDHQVCKEGDILTPETAKILKLLGYQMAEFHISINCMWSQDGTFVEFIPDDEPDTTKNKSIANRKSDSTVSLKNSSCVEAEEEMEDEEDEVSDSSEAPELVEPESNTSDVTVKKDEVESPPAKSLDSATHTSTPKDKTGITVEENGSNVKENGTKTSEGTPVSKAKKAKKLVENDSVPVTPDIANSSQESPVFRELRSRSVKVNRKRK